MLNILHGKKSLNVFLLKFLFKDLLLLLLLLSCIYALLGVHSFLSCIVHIQALPK